MERQIASRQLQMAQQTAADEAAIRERVLGRVSDLDETLKDNLASMGGFAMTDGQDILRNYDTFRQTAMDDLDRTVINSSSTGQANAIRRGMDRSTQRSDEQADLIRRTQDVVPKINQAAFDAAINRSKQFADAQNYGRVQSQQELSDTLSNAINFETPFATNNAVAQMGNVGTNFNKFSTQAGDRSAESQGELGRTLANFREQVAPNMGYAYGNQPNPVDAGAGSDARYKNFLEAKFSPEELKRMRAAAEGE